MAYTETDLASIRSAIARGALEVEFADRRVRYRSITELMKAEAEIVRRLATPRAKQRRAYAVKGFGPTCA